MPMSQDALRQIFMNTSSGTPNINQPQGRTPPPPTNPPKQPQAGFSGAPQGNITEINHWTPDFRPQNPPQQPQGMSTIQSPNTYPIRPNNIIQPQNFGFGFGQGVPGGDAAEWLRNAGFPDMTIPDLLRSGAPMGPNRVAQTARQLGNFGLMSPQQMQMQGQSGMEFILGMIQTMLGMPQEDYMQAAYAPFQGLMSPQQGRMGQPRGGMQGFMR